MTSCEDEAMSMSEDEGINKENKQNYGNKPKKEHIFKKPFAIDTLMSETRQSLKTSVKWVGQKIGPERH